MVVHLPILNSYIIANDGGIVLLPSIEVNLNYTIQYCPYILSTVFNKKKYVNVVFFFALFKVYFFP